MAHLVRFKMPPAWPRYQAEYPSNSTNRSALHRVPFELVCKILENLHRKISYDEPDLCNARLINKAWSAIVTPWVFDTIPLWSGIKSLENLSNIAEDPAISRFVCKIIFSPLQMKAWPKDDALDAMSSKVHARLENTTHSLNSYRLGLEKHTEGTKCLISTQESLCETGQHVKCLIRAFRRLPNLKALNIEYGDYSIGAHELVRNMGFTIEGEVDFRCWAPLSQIFQALSGAETKLQSFNLGRFRSQYMVPELLEEFNARGPAISVKKNDTLLTAKGFSQFFPYSFPDVPWINVLSTVRQVELDLRALFKFHHRGGMVVSQSLGKILQWCAVAEKVVLKCSHME